MKFLALLGSVFLPASLVAVRKLTKPAVSEVTDRYLQSILSVPTFQFLAGAELFGVYIALTVPAIGMIVYLCNARPRMLRWQVFRHGSVAKTTDC